MEDACHEDIGVYYIFFGEIHLFMDTSLTLNFSLTDATNAMQNTFKVEKLPKPQSSVFIIHIYVLILTCIALL